MADYQHVNHGFGPVYDEKSKILILGSFPSVKSREAAFFYGHPQNRFWKVLARLYQEELPQLVEERRCFLLRHQIALWDAIESCDIIGSSDASIKNVEPVDIMRILTASPIQAIYGNGTKACQMYNKYLEPITKRTIIPLPSTSPANAAWSLERLAEAWKIICMD